MGEEDEAPEMVANPYRAAMVNRRASARPHANALRDRLDAVVTAMQADAWVSTTATSFETDLTGHRTMLESAASGSITEFDTAIAGQPVQVEEGAWQTHWHNLRP